MTQNRPGHDPAGQPGTEPDKARDKQQNRGDELDDPAADPANRFRTDFGENVDGFLRAGEFKKQRLHQDDRRSDPANLISDFHDSERVNGGMHRIRRMGINYLTWKIQAHDFGVAISSPTA